MQRHSHYEARGREVIEEEALPPRTFNPNQTPPHPHPPFFGLVPSITSCTLICAVDLEIFKICPRFDFHQVNHEKQAERNG